MRRRMMTGAMALVSAAGLARAQDAIPPLRLEVPVPVLDQGMMPVPPIEVAADDKVDVRDLRVVAQASGLVFDGELIRKTTFTPPGMRVLVTEYTFRVHESLRGGAPADVTVRETGGELANGDGMTTGRSHKLAEGGRYIVFLRPDAGEILAPFQRVLQVMDGGATVADETGRIAIGVRDGALVTRRRAEVASMSYIPAAPVEEPVNVGPPTIASEPLPPQPAAEAFPDRGPIPVGEVLAVVRQAGASGPATKGPAGLSSAAHGATDWNWCGYMTGAANFASLMPDNNQWAWLNTAMADWDTLVGAGGSSTWIFGLLTTGGNPIRNENPVANNNRHNAATPSDATMVAGGYGTWAANGSPNGICFIWYSGGNCTRLRETDVFVNPSNGTNELQYRKSMVHELGHALGLGHEGLYNAIMVSGTWRVPPNYGSFNYTRLDDAQGARSMLNWTNTNGFPGTWAYQNWRDISTLPQTHPNAGSAGDIGPNVTTLSTFFASTGNTVTVQRMHVENRGRVGYAGPVALNIYLSTNNIISSGDYLVWSGGWGSYPAEGASYNFNVNFTVPATVPTGNYYIGWIVSSPDGQLDGGNDTAIMVRDSSGSFAQRTIAISNTVPANDSCGSAFNVPVGTYSGSTTSATNDGATNCGNFGAATPDVWYSFTAPCNGQLLLDTCGSNYDTVLSVHSACAGTAANTVACDDDGGVCGPQPYRQSSLAATVSAGTTYLVRVSGYNGATGSYTLNVGFSAAVPPNDDCSSAIAIGNGTYAGSTTCGVTDGTTTCGTSDLSPDVWYVYVPVADGALSVDTCGSSYDTVISVHSGCPGTPGDTLACDDDGCGYPNSALSVPVSALTPYYIRVSGYNGSFGNFVLNTSFAPANDTCENAVPISEGSFAFTTIGAATDGPTEPNCSFCCGDPQVNQDVWFLYTATCDGTAEASLCDADYDSKIAIYDGTACPHDPGTALACNDDACGGTGLASLTSWTVTAGASYYIRVGGYTTFTGSGTLSVACTPAATPCYPNCDGSTVLPCLNVSDFACFLNSFASGDPYANCDQSTSPPVLNVQDFSCFLNAFASGCSGC